MTTQHFNVGPLEELLKNPLVYEIDVNAPDSIYYWHRDEGRKQHTQAFANEAEVRQLAEALAAAENATLNYQNPIVETRLEDGTRLLLMIPPVSSKGTVIRILKSFHNDMSLERLVEINALSQPIADFLRAAVQAAANVLVIGGHSSGKTTLLHVLYQQIHPEARIVVIQPFSGFHVSHHNSVVLETRNPDLNGTGAISEGQLMAHVDTLRPDRLILADSDGAGIARLLDLFSIGQRGMLNINANSPRDALMRLESFAAQGNLSRPLQVIREQISRSFDLIVHIELAERGVRRVMSIQEVGEMRGDAIVLESVFEYEPQSDSFKATGHKPKLLEQIRAKGITLADDLFA